MLKLPMFYFNARDIQKQSFTGVEAGQSQVFFKICVLKNLAIFAIKYLCRSLLLTNWQAFMPATLLKRDSNTGVSL